jgi:hypothetical protein
MQEKPDLNVRLLAFWHGVKSRFGPGERPLRNAPSPEYRKSRLFP